MSYYVNPVPPTPQLKKFRNPPRACILLVSIPPHWKHCCYLLLIWALRLPTHHLLVPFSPACRPLSPKKKNATTDPLTDHSCHTTMTRRPPLPFGAPLLHHVPFSQPYRSSHGRRRGREYFLVQLISLWVRGGLVLLHCHQQTRFGILSSRSSVVTSTSTRCSAK
jgi:hypothetical protein